MNITCPCGKISKNWEDYAQHYMIAHTAMETVKWKNNSKYFPERFIDCGVKCGCGEVFGFLLDWADHLKEVDKQGGLEQHVIMGETARALR